MGASADTFWTSLIRIMSHNRQFPANRA